MRRILSPALSVLLLSHTAATCAPASAQDAAKIIQPPEPQAQQAHAAQAARPAAPMTNADVLRLVEARVATEIVVEKIKVSPCDFDTSPAALKELKEAGVPDSLLLIMVMSPKCNPQPARRVAVEVPAGTVVELETAYTINSQLVRAGDAVSFRVVNPVMVGGQVVIEKGATATALVTKAERNGHWGRAGRITWVMKEVTAADGSRVPLQFTGHAVGDSKGAKVAAQTVLLGAGLMFLSPLALTTGFKRGENAIVPEGKRFDAQVFAPAQVFVPAR